MASTRVSLINFFALVTVMVGSPPSSSMVYSMLALPALAGSKAALFFCGIPTTAAGPVLEAMTPILTCAMAARGSVAQSASSSALRNFINVVLCTVSSRRLNRSIIIRDVVTLAVLRTFGDDAKHRARHRLRFAQLT